MKTSISLTIANIDRRSANVTRTLIKLVSEKTFAISPIKLTQVYYSFRPQIMEVTSNKNFIANKYDTAILASFVLILAQTAQSKKKQKKVKEFFREVTSSDLNISNPASITRDWLKTHSPGSFSVSIESYYFICYALYNYIKGNHITSLIKCPKAVSWFKDKNLDNIALIVMEANIQA